MMRTFQRMMVSAVACLSLMAATGCDERAVMLFVSQTTAGGALDNPAVCLAAKAVLDEDTDALAQNSVPEDGYHMQETQKPKDAVPH